MKIIQEEKNEDFVEEAVHKIVEEIETGFKAIEESAYTAYKPMVVDVCARQASEAEVESLLDHMVSHCGAKRMLNLFKQVCRRYYYQYPELITFEVYEYKDIFENDYDIED